MKDLTGNKYNRLTVISFDKRDDKSYYWNCQCDCGNIKSISYINLTSGHTKSCGCLKIEKLTKHGYFGKGKIKLSEYNSWINMKDRCYNPNYESYQHYGGRGIIVCEKWINSFEDFLNDMGMKPGKGYSVDRIDTNGNYELDNCKWSTQKEQCNNKRNNLKK